MNRKNIHKDYLRLGVKVVTTHTTNATTLQSLLDTLLHDYKHSIAQLPRKQATGTENNLLSLTKLTAKLLQDIADQLGHESNDIVTTKKLVELIAPTEQSIVHSLHIPEPAIEGTIEHRDSIILPPDQLEIVIGSGTGREQLETAGYDKIGLIEGRIADQLSLSRKHIHRQTGIVTPHQMRKVSYYFTYIPQRDVTIISNNQYGEGTFVAQGQRPYHTETKQTNKGGPDFVSVLFDYQDPSAFLVRLGIAIRGMGKTESVVAPEISKFEKSVKQSYSKATIISLIKPQRTNFISMKFRDRIKRTITDDNSNKIISYVKLCRLFGFQQEIKKLYKDEIFYELCEKIFEITVHSHYRELLYSQRTTFISMKNKDRIKRVFTDENNNIIVSYVELCRIFGFKDKARILCKNEKFYSFCEKLFNITIENHYRELLYSQRTTFISMKNKNRSKRSLTDDNGNEIISYIELCRFFGFQQERKYLINDNIFHQLCEKIFGKNIKQKIKRAQYIMNMAKQKEIRTLLYYQCANFISMKVENRIKRTLTDDNDNKIISYVKLCRLFGFQQEIKELYKDEIFYPLCSKLFNNETSPNTPESDT